MRGVVIELGQLPVVEHAEVVELLLDRTRHALQLLEVVGGAARTGQALEAGRLRRGRDLLGHRLGGGTDVDTGIALRPRNAVDRGRRAIPVSTRSEEHTSELQSRENL